MIISLNISLILTLVIELSVSLILGIRNKNDIIVVICANVCTNPIVVYIANIVHRLENNILYNIVVAILEFLAVLVEYKLYKNYLSSYKKSPLKLSVVCNVVSFAIGVVINSF